MRPAVIVAFLTVSAASRVWACVCPGIPTLERSRLQATAMFEGVVVAKRVVVTSEWDGWYSLGLEYDFAVVHMWKGEADQELTLTGSLGGCSKHFAPGRRYLVFAVQGSERKSLRDLDCGSTHRVLPHSDSPATYMGAPLATFREPSPASLPAASPPIWYKQRARLAAGTVVFANLAAHGAEAVERTDDAPLGMVVAGLMCALVPLIGMAASFRKPLRAIALLVLASVLILMSLSVAGHFSIANPMNPSELAWPLRYMIPDALDR
jgi:hypothetical protein